MGTVGLFCTRFLPYSQTFIFDEIRQHVRYAVEVFTRKRLLADRFPYSPVHVAGALYGTTRRDRRFDRRLSVGTFDLLHAHFGTGAVYALPFAERHRLPLVVTFHGHDVSRLYTLERYHPASWRYALVHRRLFCRMTLGLCASQDLLELLLEMGAPANKLRLHSLGIDPTAFARGRRDASEVRVAMVGRLVPKKGFHYGIRAFAKSAAERPSMKLIIVGDGTLKKELRQLVERLGISDQVTFTGVLAPEAVRATLAQSDVLLAPSIVDAVGDRESGLIVVKEASASEVVPVGTYHGGIPEIIEDGRTGFLLQERDVEGLARRLSELADDAPLRDRLGSAARQKMMSDYDNRNCVERLERFYDDAIDVYRP